MFEIILASLTLAGFTGRHTEIKNSDITITHAGCEFDVQQIDFFSSKELWVLDYLDMLQSPNGPLLRYFVYADYRQKGDGEKNSLAVLVISHKLRAENVNVFLVSSVGAVKLSRISVADEDTGFDFRLKIDFSDCGNAHSEEAVFFEVLENTVGIHHNDSSSENKK
jgi:hypothetical protein